MNCDGEVIPLLSKELSLLLPAKCNNAAPFKGEDDRGRDEEKGLVGGGTSTGKASFLFCLVWFSPPPLRSKSLAEYTMNGTQDAIQVVLLQQASKQSLSDKVH